MAVMYFTPKCIKSRSYVDKTGHNLRKAVDQNNVFFVQIATGSGGDLESFCYTPCYNSIFNAYDGCGFTDTNPVAGT